MLRRPVYFVVLVAAAASCNPTIADQPFVPVVGVKVTPQSKFLVAIGDTGTIVATVSPANATDKVVTWESTDSTIVRVDSKGHLTARAVGSGVFITAITQDGRFQASANVSVNP